MALREGDLLDGKYRVERVLGQGGMGVVLAARHEQLGERVAIKVLHEAFADERARARFLNEGRSAAKLRSEHVARVLDVGESAEGQRYLVLEHLDGADLSRVQRERGSLPVEEVVDWLIQVCAALVEAHALGIVHRDIKPANLFLTRRADGSACVKVLDFGISKNPDAELTSTTMEGMGSPHYMAPEQMASAKNVDGRADVWSCGAVAFKLLTGEAPFGSGAITEVVHNVVTDRRKRLSELRPDVPPGLERVLDGCLQRAPEARVPDVATLARELGPFASSDGKALAERVGGTRASVPWVAPEPPAKPDRGEETRAALSLPVSVAGRRNGAAVAAAVAIGAGLLVAIGIALGRLGGDATAASPPVAATQPPSASEAPPLATEMRPDGPEIAPASTPSAALSPSSSSSAFPVARTRQIPNATAKGKAAASAAASPSEPTSSEYNAYDHR